MSSLISHLHLISKKNSFSNIYNIGNSPSCLKPYIIYNSRPNICYEMLRYTYIFHKFCLTWILNGTLSFIWLSSGMPINLPLTFNYVPLPKYKGEWSREHYDCIWKLYRHWLGQCEHGDGLASCSLFQHSSSKAWSVPPCKFTIALSSHITFLIGGFTIDCKIPTWLMFTPQRKSHLLSMNKSQHYFASMLSKNHTYLCMTRCAATWHASIVHNIHSLISTISFGS